MTSVGFRLGVRWDLEVNKFLWKLQPPKFFVFFFFFSSTADIWQSVKWLTHRLREPNERHNMGRKYSDLFSSSLLFIIFTLPFGGGILRPY